MWRASRQWLIGRQAAEGRRDITQFVGRGRVVSSYKKSMQIEKDGGFPRAMLEFCT